MTTPSRPAYHPPHCHPAAASASGLPTPAPDTMRRIAEAGIAAAASIDAAALTRTLQDVPDTLMDQVSEVLAAMIGTVLLHVHGRLPDAEQITAVAEQIASAQVWPGVTPPVIVWVLHGVVRAHPLPDVVSRGDEHLLFVCAAHLITAHHDVVPTWRHPIPIPIPIAAAAPHLMMAGAAS